MRPSLVAPSTARSCAEGPSARVLVAAVLDAVFEASWRGKSSSPEVSVDANSQALLNGIGSIFKAGATVECKFSMQREPHYVLLRREYYTRTTTAVGYEVPLELRASPTKRGSAAAEPQEGKPRLATAASTAAANRASLVQLMAAWAVEWLAVQPAFQEDVQRMLAGPKGAVPKHMA